MALILYPITSYDAFISVANCDTFLNNNVIGSQRTAYDALTETEKEIYIRQATTFIKQDITLPSTLETNLQHATAYLINYSIGIDMVANDNDSNIKVDEVVGVVKTEFFGRAKEINSLPEIVQKLLSGYEVQTDGVFRFERS